jgi:hypothetical protein
MKKSPLTKPKFNLNQLTRVNTLVGHELHDGKGRAVYVERHHHSSTWWEWTRFNDHDQVLEMESSNGFWTLRRYDEKGEPTYWETQSGVLLDRSNRTK